MPNPSAGDRLRITTDNPYDTDLRAGDIVTVVRTGSDAMSKPILLVVTADNRRWLLHPDVVEPAPTYVPAEPDEIVDTMFTAIMSREMTVEFVEDITALDDAEYMVESSVDADDDEYGDDHGDCDNNPGDGSPHFHVMTTNGADGDTREYVRNVNDPRTRLVIVDQNGDAISFTYGEEEDNPRHAVIYMADQGRAAEIPIEVIPSLIAWLHDRINTSRRTTD